MILKIIDNIWNRYVRNDINYNFKTIEDNFDNVVNVVSNEAFDKVVNAAKLIWKEPVTNFAALSTTYPNPEEGWTSMTRDNGKVYRYYVDSGWKEVQEISVSPINELDNRLTPKVDENTDKLLHLSVDVSEYDHLKVHLDGDRYDYAPCFNAAIDALDNMLLIPTNKSDVVREITYTGMFLIGSPLISNKTAMKFRGVGLGVLKATRDFPSNEFILTIGESDTRHVQIENTTFTKEGANFLETAEYDQSLYGDVNSPSNNYDASCGGLRIYKANKVTISTCIFTGLNLGLSMDGAYSTLVDKNCRFTNNNRHIKGDTNSANSADNNFIEFSYCHFEEGRTNGAVFCYGFNGVKFDKCDFEGNGHLALYLRKCASVNISGFYSERNNRFTDKSGVPASVYNNSVFKTVHDDGVVAKFDGYDIGMLECEAVNINNSIFFNTESTSPNAKGFIYNSYCVGDIVVESCKMRAAFLPVYITAEQSTTTSNKAKYRIKDCVADPIWKLTDIMGSKIENSSTYTSDTYTIPRVYYVNLQTGNDNQLNYQMTASNPIKNLSQLVTSLPHNTNLVFEINVVGTAVETILYSPQYAGGTIRFIGNSSDKPNIGYVRMSAIPNGRIMFSNVDMEAVRQSFILDTGGYVDNYSRGTLSISNADITNISRAHAIIVLNTGMALDLNNCTINQIASQTTAFTVSTLQEAWITGCTINKTYICGDRGKIYYKNNNIAPTMGSGIAGFIHLCI